jgi:hypothetical protein
MDRNVLDVTSVRSTLRFDGSANEALPCERVTGSPWGIQVYELINCLLN